MGATAKKLDFIDEMEDITKNFLQNQKAGTGMQMYKVMMLPMAEEDIMNNTDYIAFEKKVPETVLELAMGFRNTIAKLEFMPKQHELDEDEELAAREIRKLRF